MNFTFKDLAEGTFNNGKNIVANFDGHEVSLEDLETNSIVFGGTGSGKTKTVLIPLLDGLIKNNLPGLIIDVKNNFSDEVYKMAKIHGREKDIVEIGSFDSAANINILNGIDHNMLMSIMKDALFNEYSLKEPYWVNKGLDIFYDISRMYYTLYDNGIVEAPTLSILYTLISSDSYAENIYSLYINHKNLYPTEFNKIINKIHSNAFHIINKDLEELEPNTTRYEQLGWTIGLVSSMLSYFSFPESEQKFSNFNNKDFSLNFEEYFYNKNKIVILRFKESENHFLSNIVSSLISLKSKQDIMLSKRDKYSFKMVDEYQNNMNANQDASWLDKSREFKNIQIFATQSISALFSKTPNKDAVYSIIDNCRNKFFLNSNNAETMLYYQQISVSHKDENLKFLKCRGDKRECIFNIGDSEYKFNLGFEKYQSLLNVLIDPTKHESLDSNDFEDLKMKNYYDLLHLDFEREFVEASKNNPIALFHNVELDKCNNSSKATHDIEFVSKFRDCIKETEEDRIDKRILFNSAKLYEPFKNNFSFDKEIGFVIVAPPKRGEWYDNFMSKFKEGLEEQTFIENYQIDEQSTLDDNWLDTHIIVNDIIIFLYEEEDFVTLARERYFLQNLQYHLETSTFSINFLALGNSDFKHPINLAADFVYNDSEEAANNIISDLHTLSKQSDLNSFLKDRKPYSWNIAPNGY